MRNQNEVEKICRRLKPLIGGAADYLYLEYITSKFNKKAQVGELIDLCYENYLKEEPLSKPNIILDPSDPINLSGDIFVGSVLYNNQPYENHRLHLREEDFIKQVGIFAITSEGKTNLAFLMALQLLKKNIPFLVIDWKRTWRNLFSLKDKIPELENVHIFTIGKDISPFKWNPFRAPPGTNQQNWVGNVASALEHSHLSGPGVYYHLSNIFNRLFKGLPEDFYPNFFDGLSELKYRSAKDREFQWKQSGLRILYDFTIGEDKDSFNERNPLKLENLLNKPVIIELDLELPEWKRIFFAEVILRWIHLYRLQKLETDKLQHVLFLEEAHNLFQKKGFERKIGDLENIYREIRAFGQGLVTITQHPSMLPTWVLGNCHTQMFLGLQHEDDLRSARKSLFLDYVDEGYPSLLKVGESIVKVRGRVDPCHVQIPLVPVTKGIIDDNWIKENARSYLPLVYQRESPEKCSSSPEVRKRENSFPILPNKRSLLLVDIFRNPFSKITERYERLDLSAKIGNKFRADLEAENLIRTVNIYHSRGKITLLELTPKGRLFLRDMGYNAPLTPNESLEHLFWKNKIAEFYKTNNKQVHIEKEIPGQKPDITVIDDKHKVAVEIETGKSDFIKNIKKSLNSGFDEIISIATNKVVKDIIKRQAAQNHIDSSKVKIMSVFEYDIN